MKDMLKSTTSIVRMKVWEIEPLVPMTVTMNCPTKGELNVKVERPVLDEPAAPRTTLVGFKDTAGPAGFAKDTRDTVPAKPPRL